MTVGATGVRAIRPYYSVAAAYRERAASRTGAAEAAAQVRAALLDSVRHHLVADVPVGAFLSAGIDSGSLVGLMRDAGQSEIAPSRLALRSSPAPRTTRRSSPRAWRSATRRGTSRG